MAFASVQRADGYPRAGIGAGASASPSLRAAGVWARLTSDLHQFRRANPLGERRPDVFRAHGKIAFGLASWFVERKVELSTRQESGSDGVFARFA